MGSRFSGSGIGQVVNGLNEQGGLYASLKSRCRAVPPQVRVQEASGLVRLVAARCVVEHEIETSGLRRERPQAQHLAVQRELDDAFESR